MASVMWGGAYPFRLNAVAVHEDTLRVTSSYRANKEGLPLRLVLPTLCISYAEAKFQNQIGGQQQGYPQSLAYGPVHFDPPVLILGEGEVQRLTYIRGAHRVEIGARETVVEFRSDRPLVVPRLRLSRKDPATLEIKVPRTPIAVQQPLRIDVAQLADGRSVGGVRMEKRHPDWKPAPVKEVYRLQVRLTEGGSGQPLVRREVQCLRWDAKTGNLQPDVLLRTDAHGWTKPQQRTSGELQACVARLPGHRVAARCFRPLAGQNVRLHLRAWPLTEALVPYRWRKGDELPALALLCGHPVEALLAANQLDVAAGLKSGQRVILPCWRATYHLEPWDDWDHVAAAFGYRDARGLARSLGLKSMDSLDVVVLPGWNYFFARAGDTLDAIDRMFGLPKGSTRTVGRVHHPDANRPYAGETLAVPTPAMARRAGLMRVSPAG